MKIYRLVENHIEKWSSTGNTFLANSVLELTPSPERGPQVRICPSPLNINDGYYGPLEDLYYVVCIISLDQQFLVCVWGGGGGRGGAEVGKRACRGVCEGYIKTQLARVSLIHDSPKTKLARVVIIVHNHDTSSRYDLTIYDIS